MGCAGMCIACVRITFKILRICEKHTAGELPEYAFLIKKELEILITLTMWA